jgi:hypothetical protein
MQYSFFLFVSPQCQNSSQKNHCSWLPVWTGDIAWKGRMNFQLYLNCTPNHYQATNFFLILISSTYFWPEVININNRTKLRDNLPGSYEMQEYLPWWKHTASKN